jgi:hypothetical protein
MLSESLPGGNFVKRLVVLLFVALLGSAVAAPAFAGGDKNRGEKGDGAVVQEQIRNSDCGTPAFSSE